MARFGTFDFGEELFGDGSSGGVLPEPTFLVRVPWVLQEIHDPDLYEFAVNPLDVQMSGIRKTFTTQKTSNGKNVVSQGRNQVQTMSFSGTILTEIHLEILREWMRKEKQVSITDDLGQQTWVYFTRFSPTRRYSPQYPWRHEYSAEATILSWG